MSPTYGVMPHLEQIGYYDYLAAPETALTGERIVVAVIDTGVSLSNAWLRQRVVKVWQVDIGGQDIFCVYERERTQTEEPEDSSGHGTAMTRLLGAPYHGTAPGVDVHVYGLATEDGRLSSASALRKALDHVRSVPDIAIVNLSLDLAEVHPPDAQGAAVRLEGDLKQILQALAAAGKAVVTTAGNRTESQSCTGFLGRLRAGCTAGAAERGSGWVRCEYSCSGNGPAGDVPDIYAPGGDIHLGRMSHLGTPEMLCGTSVSTALTSGVLALGAQKICDKSGRPLAAGDVDRLIQTLRVTGDPVSDHTSLQTLPSSTAINVLKFIAAL